MTTYQRFAMEMGILHLLCCTTAATKRCLARDLIFSINAALHNFCIAGMVV